MRRTLLGLIAFTSILVSGSCIIPDDPVSRTQIAGPVRLGPMEREFIFDRPFKPDKQIVEVCFEFSDHLMVSKVSKDPVYSDGTSLEITAWILGNTGIRYDLTHRTISTENYICFSPELTDEWLRITESKISFVKLAVRTNRPLNIVKIEWATSNSWEI